MDGFIVNRTNLKLLRTQDTAGPFRFYDLMLSPFIFLGSLIKLSISFPLPEGKEEEIVQAHVTKVIKKE